MTNVYLFVTRSGQVYDRTFGKNKRLCFDAKYTLKPHGSIMLTKDGDKIILSRLDKYNNIVYNKILTESGMYVSTKLYCDPVTKTSKYTSTAYNYAKAALVNNYEFSTGEYDRPFVVKLKLWTELTIKHKFFIEINENSFNAHSLSDFISTLESLTSVDIAKLVKYYNAHSMTFIINDAFFDTIQSLGLYRTTLTQASNRA